MTRTVECTRCHQMVEQGCLKTHDCVLPVGRPKLPEGEARDAMLKVRVLEDEKRIILEAARLANVSVSEYVRVAVLDEARRILL